MGEGGQRNYVPLLVWVQIASRDKVCQATEQYFENVSSKMSCKTVENELLAEDTKWYTTNWGRGKVIEKDGKKIFWDWE